LLVLLKTAGSGERRTSGVSFSVDLLAGIRRGYLGAGTARRLGQQTVRRIVIAIGLGMALSLFIKK